MKSLLSSYSNIDRSNFSPLVGIASIPASESVPLTLVAVTANGVRFFFSTGNHASVADRPNNLILQHVRLPPGFAATTTVPKPAKVHMCYYKQGERDIAIICYS